MTGWIDTHAHLDAAEFDPDRDAMVARARAAGVSGIVIPAVAVANFDTVRALAHRHGLAYALGIHPMCTPGAGDADLAALDAALAAHRDDPHLVAVGEIGLDHFVPGLDAAHQRRLFEAQLGLAAAHGLPVILHVRQSVDAVTKALRTKRPPGGIAHAFNGSLQQARVLHEMGFALGFGGNLTFERANRIRALARELPLAAIVTETDAPDIPPQWLYRTREARDAGASMRNEPAELPRIAGELAALRGLDSGALREATVANAHRVLPRLAALGAGAIP